MEKKWRLIIDDKRDGYENMAIDEALFSGYTAHRVPTIRIYGWKRPFISLGYRQNPHEVLNDGNDLSFVRRLTGGSAILHDKEVTYSIVCAEKDLGLPSSVKKSYYRLSSFLKVFYKNLGLRAAFAFEEKPLKVSSYGIYCFSTWQNSDLLIEGKKIGGNAQRRKKQIIFQHGSIPQVIDHRLLNRSIRGCENVSQRSTALDDLLKESSEFKSLQNILAASFREAFKVACQESSLFPGERSLFNDLLVDKYKQRWWNYARSETGLA
jgi:lipoyl(octanoyl) transferase